MKITVLVLSLCASMAWAASSATDDATYMAALKKWVQLQGVVGATGAQGPQGVQGIQGPVGPQGPKGDPGGTITPPPPPPPPPPGQISWKSVPAMGNNWDSAHQWAFGANKYWPETAQKSYDIQVSTNTTSPIARFEVRPNELWSGAVGGNDTERSEADGSPTIYPKGTSLWVGYTFLLEPGAPQINTAGGNPGGADAWFIIGQIHASASAQAIPGTMKVKTVVSGGSSKEYLYFAIEQDPNQKEVVLWTDANPYVRGTPIDVVINMKTAGLSTDFCNLWINGVQVGSYTGVIGSVPSDPGFYFKFGIYRGWQGDGLPVVAAQYANVVQGTASLSSRATPSGVMTMPSVVAGFVKAKKKMVKK